MDQVHCHPRVCNPNESVLNGAFSSTCPFPNFSASEKPPSSTTRLSKPRMVKQRRRHAAQAPAEQKVSSFGGAEPLKSGNEGHVLFGSSNSGREDNELGLKSAASLFGTESKGGLFTNSDFASSGLGSRKYATSGFAGNLSSGVVSGSDVFVFGSGAGTSSNSGCSSRTGFGENKPSNVRGDLRRRDVENSDVRVGFDNSSTGGTVDNNSKVELTNINAFGEEASLTLPEEMKKLKLETFTDGVSLERVKVGNRDSSEVDGKTFFVFGSGKNMANSVDKDTSNMFCEDVKKVNTGSRATTLSSKHGIKNPEPYAFIFRSNSKKAPVSAQTTTNIIDEDTVINPPINTRKTNTGASTNYGSSFVKINDDDSCSKANDTNQFVFSTSKCASGYFGEGGVSSLHAETESNSESIKTDLMAGSYSSCNLNHSVGGKSHPSQFTFQAVKQGSRSDSGSIPSKNSNHFIPSVFTKVPFHSSSTDSGSVSVAAEAESAFTSFYEEAGKPHADCQTPKKDTSFPSQEGIFSVMRQSLSFSVGNRVSKDGRRKTKRGKLRNPLPVHSKVSNASIPRDSGSQENPEPGSPGSCSPMDLSPQQVNTVGDQFSRDATITTDDYASFNSHNLSKDTVEPFFFETTEDLVSAGLHLGISEHDQKSVNEGNLQGPVKKNLATKSSVAGEFFSEPGHESHSSSSEKTDTINGSCNEVRESITGFSCTEKEDNDGRSGQGFCSSSGDVNHSNFTFTASISTQDPLSASKRLHRRRRQTKVGQNDHNSTANENFHIAFPCESPFPFSSSSAETKCTQKHVPEVVSFDNQRKEAKKAVEVKQEFTSSTASVAAQESCKKWRLRGNQAYTEGSLYKAEEYYTCGVNCVSPNERSRGCTRALMLCYSNRAATRMSLGRMREALSDCMMAVAIDASFLRAQVRAANCHLALGEVEDASKLFNTCLKLGNNVSLDTKVLDEAASGLRKAQQVADCIECSADLLKNKSSNDVTNALQIISKALSISPYSERLTELKAQTLLMLRNYEEVIRLCEQTLESAERNSFVVNTEGQSKLTSAKIWRWCLISRSYFFLGRLEEALDLLQKNELGESTTEKNNSLESLQSFSITLKELLRLKAAGNDAFKAGGHLEAVECYTAALTCNVDSRPFAAICFCNRAAAYQALGQITNAIADCSLATVLDANYTKAISRRSTLHEMIRDYGQAITDLNRLISVLQRQTEDKAHQSGRLASNGNDLKRARKRLTAIEAEARKGIPLNMYMILGIDSSSSSVDIKKAYHKAALRHHPDKAGQFLARGESNDDGLWREVADEVHRNADHLFKMIGEAYSVLSDPAKRMQYDEEEEMRTSLMRCNGWCASPDSQRHCEKNGNRRRQSQESWKSYRYSDQRWSESSWSSRYF